MSTTEYWKPDDPEFILNPYPNYKKLRDKNPVFQSTSGDYIILSYNECRKALIDKTFKAATRTAWLKNLIEYAKKKGKDYSAISQTMYSFLVQMNPPEHTDLRRIISSVWPKKSELELLVNETTDDLVKNLPQKGDLVVELAKTLPLKVINRILGYPTMDLTLLDDGSTLLSALNPYLTLKDLDRINDASKRLYSKFEIFCSEISPEGPFLASQLKKVSLNEKHHDLDWTSVTLSLFIASFETTRSLLSSVMCFLIQKPDYQNLLTNDGSIENFIHEILRLEAPIQMTGRINTSAIELNSIPIAPKSGLTLCIGAANRDPKMFENPDEVDLERDPRNHLSFGAGIHHCLGSQIAIMECMSLIKHILPILPSIKLLEEPTYDPVVTIRNITSLKYQKI